METEQQIAALRLRIRKGEFETERWRATGPAEKYLESFCDVESLEQQLDQLLRGDPVQQATEARPRTPFA